MFVVYKGNEIIGTFHSFAMATLYLEETIERWEEKSENLKIVLDKRTEK